MTFKLSLTPEAVNRMNKAQREEAQKWLEKANVTIEKCIDHEKLKSLAIDTYIEGREPTDEEIAACLIVKTKS